MDTYGVLNKENVYIETSKTLRGAKIYATRNGYNKVAARINNGYTVKVIAVKLSFGKWVNDGEQFK